MTSVISPREARAEGTYRWIFFGVGSAVAVIDVLTARLWASENKELLDALSAKVSTEIATSSDLSPGLLAELTSLKGSLQAASHIDTGVMITSSFAAAGAFFTGSALLALANGLDRYGTELDQQEIGERALFVTVPVLVVGHITQLATAWAATKKLWDADGRLSSDVPQEIKDSLHTAIEQGKGVYIPPTVLSAIGVVVGTPVAWVFLLASCLAS